MTWILQILREANLGKAGGVPLPFCRFSKTIAPIPYSLGLVAFGVLAKYLERVASPPRGYARVSAFYEQETKA